MSSKPSFSLGRALSAAFASLPAAWGGAWLILIVLWAAGSFHRILIEYLLAAHIGPVAQGIAAVALLIVILAVKLASQGALYRIAIFGKSAQTEGLGFGGLQFSAPELRLFVSCLVVALFILMVAIAAFVVFAVAFNSSGLGNGYDSTLAALCAVFHRHQGIDWLFIGYVIAAFVFMIFVELKFVLAFVATVAERRIVTLNALGLSSGNVGKLFLGILVFVVPFVAAAIACVALLAHGGLHALHSAGILYAVVIEAIAVFLVLPLTAGFLASAYSQIVQKRAG